MRNHTQAPARARGVWAADLHDSARKGATLQALLTSCALAGADIGGIRPAGCAPYGRLPAVTHGFALAGDRRFAAVSSLNYLPSWRTEQYILIVGMMQISMAAAMQSN